MSECSEQKSGWDRLKTRVCLPALWRKKKEKISATDSLAPVPEISAHPAETASSTWRAVCVVCSFSHFAKPQLINQAPAHLVRTQHLPAEETTNAQANSIKTSLWGLVISIQSSIRWKYLLAIVWNYFIRWVSPQSLSEFNILAAISKDPMYSQHKNRRLSKLFCHKGRQVKCVSSLLGTSLHLPSCHLLGASLDHIQINFSLLLFYMSVWFSH